MHKMTWILCVVLEQLLHVCHQYLDYLDVINYTEIFGWIWRKSPSNLYNQIILILILNWVYDSFFTLAAVMCLNAVVRKLAQTITSPPPCLRVMLNSHSAQLALQGRQVSLCQCTDAVCGLAVRFGQRSWCQPIRDSALGTWCFQWVDQV